jgi:hypothetical protein
MRVLTAFVAAFALVAPLAAVTPTQGGLPWNPNNFGPGDERYPENNPFGQPIMQRIPWRTVYSGQHSPFQRSDIRVIGSERDLEAYWHQLRRYPQYRDLPMPSGIDFGTELVIAFHLGRQNTAGFNIRVRDIVQRQAAYWDVHFDVIQPGAGQHVGQVITSPFQIVRVQRYAGNPRFFPYYPRTQNVYILPSGGNCNGGGTTVFRFGNNQLRKVDPETGEAGPPLGIVRD